MKTCVPFLLLLFGAFAVPAQENKVVSFESFEGVELSVRNVTSQHGYSGVDEKILCRAGNLAAIAIVKTIPDGQLVSAPTMKDVLMILDMAFACPDRCISYPKNRRPQVTMLLLEHLRSRASSRMRKEIDQTREFIKRQTKGVE